MEAVGRHSTTTSWSTKVPPICTMQRAGGDASLQSGRGMPSRQPHKERAMGFFSKILEKLGIGSTAAAPTPAPPASQGAGSTAPSPPRPLALVDVVAQLKQRAAASAQK